MSWQSSPGGRPFTRPAWGRAAMLAWLAWSVFGPAHAAVSENLAVDVTAMSLGNAVTADPPGISSIHFNPAGLARLKGDQRQDSFFGASIRPQTTFTQPAGFDIGGWKEDPLAGTSTGKVRQSIYLPFHGPAANLQAAVGSGLGLSWNNPGSPWTFATATYVPMAVGFERPDPNDPGRYDGKRVILQRLVYLSPSVGYKYSDTLSFGLAVPIAHQGFALDTDMRMPNKLLGIIGKLQDGWCGSGNPLDELGFGLCGGGQEGRLRPFNSIGSMHFDVSAPFDPTLNLGTLWEPTDWFAAGVVYQTGTTTVLTGRYEFDATPMLPAFTQGMYNSLLGPIVASMFGFPTYIPPTQSGNATLKLPFPDHLQIGFKLKPIERVQFNVDANWTNWKKWSHLTFEFDQDVELLKMARLFGQADASKLVIPRQYESRWHYGFGLQLRVTDALMLRFGYEPRKSSVSRETLDLIAPLPDMTIKSVGLAYRLDSGMTINAAASYASGKYNIPADTSCNLNCTNFFNVIYNPYAGLDVSGVTRVRYGGISITQPF